MRRHVLFTLGGVERKLRGLVGGYVELREARHQHRLHARHALRELLVLCGILDDVKDTACSRAVDRILVFAKLTSRYFSSRRAFCKASTLIRRRGA